MLEILNEVCPLISGLNINKSIKFELDKYSEFLKVAKEAISQIFLLKNQEYDNETENLLKIEEKDSVAEFLLFMNYEKWIHVNIDDNNIVKYDFTQDPSIITIEKPIIYIYPKEKMKLSIKLGKPQNITCSYPKYTDGWNIVAYPDGTVIEEGTNKELYCLYWRTLCFRQNKNKF